MTEKRFTYTTRIITDKKGYCKDYIWDNETLLNTEQIVAILNEQKDYIDYVTKERNIACNKLDNYKEKIWELEKENDTLRMITGKELFKEISNLKEDLQQLEKENREAHHSKILANAFIIEKGLTKEFIKWSKENE